MIEKIYIPTVRRVDNQITYNNLPNNLKERVVMVVEPSERHLYTYDCDYLEIPEELVGTWTQLAETRLLIHKHAGKIKYCVADDDLIIIRRNSKYWGENSNMERSKETATSKDINEMFLIFDDWLDEPDIGIVALSDNYTPPANTKYSDCVGGISINFIDGIMLSKIINDIDITSIRVSEDILFLFECLARGINVRKSNEWLIDNRSQNQKDLSDSRIVWTEMYDNVENPKNFGMGEENIKSMKYIQNKYPNGITIIEKDGRIIFKKHWKNVYKSLLKETKKDFSDSNIDFQYSMFT